MGKRVEIEVQFHKQGGKLAAGRVIGRMGSQALIAYAIESGEPRERWIKANRYELPEGRSLDEVDRYARRECPGTGEPVEASARCPHCDRLSSEIFWAARVDSKETPWEGPLPSHKTIVKIMDAPEPVAAPEPAAESAEQPWIFMHRAERSKETLQKAGQTFDEYWADRDAQGFTAQIAEDATLEEALQAAYAQGLARGSARAGTFEIQSPKGIFEHVASRRIDGAPAAKIRFRTWEQIEAEEDGAPEPASAPAKTEPEAREDRPQVTKPAALAEIVTRCGCGAEERTLAIRSESYEIDGLCFDCEAERAA